MICYDNVSYYLRLIPQKRLYVVVTAVTSLRMKTPYNCPYCEQKSMRRGNLDVHIQKKHPHDYNPFPDMKQKQSDCNFSQPKKPEPSNIRSPTYDLSHRAQLSENSSKFQDVLQEISQWSEVELMFLASAIHKRLNTGSYSNYF